MVFYLKRMIAVLTLILFFSACSPSEEDFKSAVPLSERIEMMEKSADFEETETQDEEIPQEPEEQSLPQEVNLAVPFFAQAPDGNWEEPWAETCEEASITLAHAYLTDQPLSKDEFRQTLLDLVDWQNETFGDYEHTTVDQTAQMLEEFFDFTDYKILEDPTIEDLKTELGQGNLIVAPFAGRQLGNPFYSGEGPYYHMLVIKGYDDTHFITNDVGTRRGENFIYSQEVMMSALHDWHDDSIDLGDKKVLVMY